MASMDQPFIPLIMERHPYEMRTGLCTVAIKRLQNAIKQLEEDKVEAANYSVKIACTPLHRYIENYCKDEGN